MWPRSCRQSCRGGCSPRSQGWLRGVLTQLVCDGKDHSAARLVQTGPVAAVRSFLRGRSTPKSLGVAIAHPATYDTRESHEACRYCGSWPTMDLDGRLIQADALSYPETVFRAAHGAGADFLLHSESKTKGPCIARSAEQFPATPARFPLTLAMVSERSHGRDTTWILRAKQAPDFINRGLARPVAGLLNFRQWQRHGKSPPSSGTFSHQPAHTPKSPAATV